MTSLTTDNLRYINVLKIISLVALLFGCGAPESLIGQLGNDDAPGLTKAEIVMSGDKGIMNLEYREGIVLPDVHTEVDVKAIPGGYEIIRQDDKIKLEFIQGVAFSNIYVCNNCAAFYQSQMPLLWNLK